MKKSLIWNPVLPPARAYKKENLKELVKISQFIYQIGESEALRKPTKAVPLKHITAYTTQEKLKYLKKCFDRYRRITKGKGRGIAGVQVGIPEAFCLLYTPEWKKKYHFFINPKITKASETVYRYPEACMSCNSLVAPVVRPAWIEVEYFDEHGGKQLWQEKSETKEGKMYNRVLQHEIDHLHGIINIDRVQSRELVFETGTAYYEKAAFEEVQKNTSAKRESHKKAPAKKASHKRV